MFFLPPNLKKGIYFLILLQLYLVGFGVDNAFCQNKIDSLLHEIKNYSQNRSRSNIVPIALLSELSNEYLHSDPIKAKEYAHKALDLAEQQKNNTAKILALSSLGSSYEIRGKYDSALTYFEEAYRLVKKTNNQTIQRGVVLEKIGVIYKYKGKYDQAINYLLKGLEIAEKLEDDKLQGNILNSIGNVFTTKEQPLKALEYYEKSLVYKKKAGNKRAISNSMGNIAIIHQQLGNYSKSIQIFKEVLEIKQEIGDKEGEAGVYFGMAQLYDSQGKYKRALEEFKKAAKIDEELDYKYVLADDYRQMGMMYSKLGNNTLAIFYVKKAVKIAQEVNSNQILLQVYNTLTDIYEKKKDYQNAFEALRKSHQYNDSIFTEQKEKQITEINTKYETDKKDKENQLLLAQNKLQEQELGTQKSLIGGAIFIIFIFFGLAIVLNRQRMAKNKANILLLQKNKEVEQQKEEIEIKTEYANKLNEEIQSTLDIVNEQNHNITSSIKYAKRIQDAILPTRKEMQQSLGDDFFVLYKPKDIVSGDFYFVKEIENTTIVCVADCTGHGVSGAFMSMLGIESLHKITNQNITSPSQILANLHIQINNLLHQDDTKDQDGMDAVVLAFRKENNKFVSVDYAGAMNPLYYFQNEKLKTIKATKKSVGGTIYVKKEEAASTSSPVFQNHTIPLLNENKNTIPTQFYLSSDGYQDQFGGKKGKKLMTKNFRNLLQILASKPVSEQKQMLENHFEDWRGKYEQVDDVAVMGIKIV
ncbi:tetratricopeptide repeat protein [Bernardetia sp.]|uniref:tetratricopeptide repeat protein n=1 Tax=Bernardetia sp. TaxID=1937974 RepID=UPI0025BF5AFD|nr:tetratricopeptide repeat protein [Bernardetia sp.]